MKSKINIKSIIIIMSIICFASMFFINICFAANTGKIKTETANLREKPQTESKVLELTSLGDEVEIIEEVNGWYKVRYKNITGYIRKDLVEIKDKEQEKELNNNTETENKDSENVTTENETVENTTAESTTVENTITETNTIEVEEKINIEKGKYKISENLKLKIIPLISAIELNEVNKDVEIEVTEILNDWVKIRTADGIEGWVRTEKLTTIQENNTESSKKEEKNETEENAKTSEDTKTPEKTDNKAQSKTMYVNSQTVNLRQKADKTSQVIKQIAINTQVTVISTDNGWAYVDINGAKGYVAENLLSSTKQETSRGTMTERNTTKTNTVNETTLSNSSATNSTASKTGSSVVSYAKQFLGCKYVYGGTTTKGFDCSGFTQFVYKHFGINLNRTAAAQYSNGNSVTNLQAGDLVMFGKSGINHVGIYIGGNTFIHAENPSKGVTTTSLSSSYYKANYVGARRIF